MKRRITALQLFFCLFALVILVRSIQLQVFPDARLESLANRQIKGNVTSLSRRGLIYDRSGEALAISLKAKSIFFRPEILRKEISLSSRSRVLTILSQVLHLPKDFIRSKMNSEKGFSWIKRQISQQEEEALVKKGILEYGDGIGLVQENRRFYPNRELAAHILGAVGVDGQGLEGLELFYEGILGGKKMRIASSKDARGRRIFEDDNGLLAVEDGQTLILTIDKAIQYEAEKNLRLAVEEHGAKAGTVIIAEVETGEILALANYPTFNPNEPNKSSLAARRNRAITDTYEPGSTFKPLLVAMAIEKGRPPTASVFCERGKFQIGGHTISEAEAHEQFEWLTFKEILKYSSNIGAAKIALELGATNLTTLMQKLDISNKTGIDLPGETQGTFSVKSLSKSIRIANIGFGHGFTVTPLQMLTYYLALANQGKWIQPKLVKAIISEDPDSLEKGSIRWKLGHRFDSSKYKRIFSESTTKSVSKMLESVVEEKGTGTLAELPEWPVAGKTGTSQKIDSETKKYSKSKYITTFAGFAPKDKPKLVALTFLDEPQQNGKGIPMYAGKTAAPLFREVMRAGLLREKVPPKEAKQQLERIANRSSINEIASSSGISKDAPLVIETNEENLLMYPNMKGLTLRESMKIIGEAQSKKILTEDLDIEVIGSGVLKSQWPEAGEWTHAKNKVRLILSSETI